MLGVQFALILLSVPLIFSQVGPGPESCIGRSCYPDIGNLLVGRAHQLEASSTCGLRKPERFCIVSNVRDETKCADCYSARGARQDMSHRIENIATTYTSKRLENWWQARNGEENAYIQLNLEAEFQFTHLIIVFKTFRPKAMILERSFDFGNTWNIYRYFAYNCAKVFPGVPTKSVTSLNETICVEKYSSIDKSEFGEVIFKALPPNLPINNPYAREVQNLLKLTNLRINFTMLHTLGDELLTEKAAINEKYYYAIYDMVVRGRCSCYGHAAECRPEDGDVAPVHPNKLYSKCVCQHNTKGRNCELCEDFYRDQPWKAANGSQPNACKICNCNSHADRCHFDAAVYELNSRRSGGVCDECRHNTQGNQCEECQQFYYAREDLAISHPDVCQPCDCDVFGTLDGGICDGKTDPLLGTVAGRCNCKTHVTGLRCDTCQNGYWNLRMDNPDGCLKCTCNLLGTANNAGCNKISGLCECKRFVTGNNCDQCERGYWGLSDESDGCSPCGCDAGGSINGTDVCDDLTGQCPCREGITGRRCNKAETRHFIGDVAFLTYEAELAEGFGRTEVIFKPITPGVVVDWTGPGFRKAFEGDAIEFTVDNIPLSSDYRIAIRYQTRYDWDIVKVIVERPDSPDPDGVCSNTIGFLNDEQSLSLDEEERYAIVDTMAVCMEAGATYKVRLEFKQFNANPGDPNGMINVDSIVLIPEIRSIPIQNPQILQNIEVVFETNKCLHYALNLRSKDFMPDECKKLSFTIGAAVYNKSHKCECDPTGSSSSICNEHGGQCVCKENVTGRKCDLCITGTYGFGVNGCSSCNCHGTGAIHDFCDIDTGACRCFPNIGGRRCDRCIDGFWNFPNCRVCNCNGYADTCDDYSGTCLECRANTTGVSCGTCKKGYYGDPRLGSDIACRPCTCPGGADGPQHAEECTYDHRTRSQSCYCPVGFIGQTCGECDINYYGNPLEVNGTCTQCSCNENIDQAVPDSCDSVSGQCLRCLKNTEGDNCEQCMMGFYGNATAGESGCADCGCHGLGTQLASGDYCDRETGQCSCHPNVLGDKCDECAPNHWKLASGEGCEDCDCDPTGSDSMKCDEFSGMCRCVSGRGGRRCDECEENYYGDPTTDSCQMCECDDGGSASQQCDRTFGNCTCVEGVTGDKCDRCDRGTTGVLPYCSPCGDCFDNWDNIIKELSEEASRLIAKANATKDRGAVKAYEEEFRNIEGILELINTTISGRNISAEQADGLNETLLELKMALNATLAEILSLTDAAEALGDEAAEAERNLGNQVAYANELLDDAEKLMRDAEKTLNNDLQGAFTTIEASQKRSEDATVKSEDAEETARESSRIRGETEAYLTENDRDHSETLDLAGDILANTTRLTRKVIGDINGLNKVVCDRKAAIAGSDVLCDSTCGGGGCDSGCGEGSSCSEGAVGKARDAEMHVAATLATLEAKEEAANMLAPMVERSVNLTAEANDAANETVIFLEEINVNVTTHLDMLADAVALVENFFNRNHTKPEETEELVGKVLNVSIQLGPEEIEKLGQEITRIIANLTNIDTILRETADDKQLAEELKERALNVSERARNVLEQVENVMDRIDTASESQRESKESIDAMSANIAMATEFIENIQTIVNSLSEGSGDLQVILEQLHARSQEVRQQYISDVSRINQAIDESDKAAQLAQNASQAADKLETEFNGKAQQVSDKYNEFNETKMYARRVNERANSLEQKIALQNGKIKRLRTTIAGNERNIQGMKEQTALLQARMEEATRKMNQWIQYQNTCK